MLLALLTASTFARADDLQLVIKNTDWPTIALTYNDVQPGVQASILARPGMRFEVEVQPMPFPAGCAQADAADCQPEVQLSARFYETGRKKETLVSAPVVTTHVGERAMVKQGSRVPLKQADGTIAYKEYGLELQLLYIASGDHAQMVPIAVPHEVVEARGKAEPAQGGATPVKGAATPAEQTGWTWPI